MQRSVAVVFALMMGVFGMVPSAAMADVHDVRLWFSGPAYRHEVLACDDPSALRQIQSKFGEKEWKFWSPPLAIHGMDSIREVAFEPWGGTHIPRRWCQARALVSDGSMRAVHYVIGEDTGMLGVTAGVQWCVSGLDRNWANAPDCRRAMP